ncbi:MAG: hypothetical protein Q9157_006035 [Trypethelium eluteriae]
MAALPIDDGHTVVLPSLPKSFPRPESSPVSIAQSWLDRLRHTINAGRFEDLKELLHVESWWRDALTLSWDLRTLHGLPNITGLLQKRTARLHFNFLRIHRNGYFDPKWCHISPELECIETMFEFETSQVRGKGMLRLVQDFDGLWKAYVLYTAAQELVGYEDAAYTRRPHGGNNSLGGGALAGNWLERRRRTVDFQEAEPTVLVIGAGQAGLNVAARLQALGVSCLLIDRNKRIGDNWRNRYRTLVTHDPVHTSHMAYLPFPPTWPFFTPKDKLGDWFETYASAMELNVWIRTSVKSASYDEGTLTWTVDLLRADENQQRTLHPRHVIFCTGHSGEPSVPSFPGQDTFKGSIYHGSQHEDASYCKGDLHGKKVLVVGTGNSGHDVAQNYCENGADVTMIQRGSTYVFTTTKGLLTINKGAYEEGGPPTEDADVYSQSTPLPLKFHLDVEGTKEIAEAEKETLDGLRSAGFRLNSGVGGGGILSNYLRKGGGYYIDVGASKLIGEGKIKIVQSPDGIKGFGENALELADGRKLEADIVVLATGYDNMRSSVRKTLGDKVADRCQDAWGLDEEGELRGVRALHLNTCIRSKHPNGFHV